MEFLFWVVLLLAFSVITHGQEHGASLKPYISTLHHTDDTALLHCEVQGASPEPKLMWQDSEGNIIPALNPGVTERGGSYDVSLQAIVRKTDHYHCVSTQGDIVQASETFVYIHGASLERSIKQLQCEVQLDVSKQFESSAGNIPNAEVAQLTDRAGSYNVTFNLTRTKTGDYLCEATQNLSVLDTVCEDSSSKVHFGWLILAVPLAFILGLFAPAAYQRVLRLKERIRKRFDRGGREETDDTPERLQLDSKSQPVERGDAVD